MIVKPKIRGFICTSAHPDGCRAQVDAMIRMLEQRLPIVGPKRVLVIGASTGYGLATRAAAAFGAGAATLGVCYERPGSERRTATAGWYNTQALEAQATKRGLYARTINADAFSQETKQQVIDTLRRDLGPVDLVVYSLAAPRRQEADGSISTSVIKPVGSPYYGKTLDLTTNEVRDIRVEPATDEEIAATVRVMGGDDWAAWIDCLADAGLLAPNATTLAYSYVGPSLTFAIYRDGTIGRAKDDLEHTAACLRERYAGLRLNARVAVAKAVVTQASAAIPSVPLYITLLFAVMKRQGSHEGTAEQMFRLLSEHVYGPLGRLDDAGRYRVDDLELDPAVQHDVIARWQRVTSDNIRQLADIEGYWQDFHRLFGFGIDGVDYDRDIDLLAENHYPGSSLGADLEERTDSD
ncbi:MAG: trans-2-enoyl-CoA reductase family protein [Bacillota bacterium]|nr:trans-2-enoyl-CoA reductase family protein [Bacillota bacterium]